MNLASFQFLQGIGILTLLFFGIYAAWVIKNEKKIYLKKAKHFLFHDFSFAIPSWWSLKGEDNEKKIFHRADTYYDWEAQFILLEERKAPLIEQLISFMKANEIILDPENAQTREFQEEDLECLQIEGTGTEKQEERIYFDAYIVRRPEDQKTILALSKSSILNGMLEGPFFEEMMNRFLNISKRKVTVFNSFEEKNF